MVCNIPKKEEEKTMYTVTPLVSPSGGLFISNTFFFFGGGGLIEMGAYFRGGVYLNLANMMVSISHRELGYRVENLSKSQRSCLLEDLQYMNYIYLNCGIKKLRFG